MLSRDARFAWLAIVMVGGILRLMQAVQAEFPLGDGGLFLAAIDAIRDSGSVPDTIPYNGGIPFVYPPLGLIVGALVALLGVDAETVLRLLPPLLAIGGLAITPWAAARLSGSWTAGLISGAMVAVMPQAYDQVVAGGGLTRGLGVLLALATIGVAAGPTPGARRGILTGLLLGLTGLSHPRVAMFALATLAFVWWFRRTELSRRELLPMFSAVVIVVAPWLVTIAARGQVGALLAAGQRLDPVAGLVGLVAYPAMQAMDGGIPNVAVALSIAGVAVLLVSGRWKLPTWLLVIHVLGSPPFVSPVAWAIVGAAGLAHVLSTVPGADRRAIRSRPAMVGVGVLLLVAVLSASASPDGTASKQQPLHPDQVAAARGLNALPADARIAVVTSQTWGNDTFGEWLPVLSERAVVTTPQGAEWLGSQRFNERTTAHDVARTCHRLTSDCLATALLQLDLRATHIVIPRGSVDGPRAPDECCPALIETLRQDGRFTVVLDEPGALVVRWNAAGGPG